MSSRLRDIDSLFRRTLTEIQSPAELTQCLLKIYSDLLICISDTSWLQFNTLFARVSYLVTRFQLSKAWSYALQVARAELRKRKINDVDLAPLLQSCIEYLLLLGNEVDGEEKDVPQVYPPHIPVYRAQQKKQNRRAVARVVATAWDAQQKTLQVLDENQPGKECVLHYAVPGVNDLFAETIELALHDIGLPLTLGLVDIDCSEENDYTPGYIIIMPDLLLDVTNVAGFIGDGSDPPAINILEQYLPNVSSISLLIGKVANFFLDELIHDVEISFNELFTRSFKLFPMEFVRLTDQELKDVMQKLEKHFTTILDVITKRFPMLGIMRTHCIIEPSYFSPQYGIKGRLDLYYQHETEHKASIIELKSGRPFKPNTYGLSSSNYHQTLLYELLIRSVQGPKQFRSNFILYSGEAENPLRFAVSVESIQKETVQNRNQQALLQFRLMNMTKTGRQDLLAEIDPANHPDLKGFVKQNIEVFHEAYQNLTEVERKYLQSFSAYIAREHMVARIGNESGEGAGGLAGLWLDTSKSKDERYQILIRLELKSIFKNDHQTILTFHRGKETNPLANFRAGDITVLYPFYTDTTLDPTKFQLHRGNLLHADSESVTIRLRNHQVNTADIEKIQYWNVEHDLLDSSFRSLYQSLWALMSADASIRQMVLGEICPSMDLYAFNGIIPAQLTPAQANIFQEGINAKSLYLLWGPPGTGKTSIMLKHWVDHFYQNTNQRILLLAYTNRAVDEICHALNASEWDLANHYIRIGSKAATHDTFKPRLLDHVIGPMTKRAEIKSLLQNTRIIVGTVASILGKYELFELIDFDLAIVDEASQLLEPALVGLMTRTRKAILIGDHMQLPAVSVQPASSSRVKADEQWAHAIGLTDLSMSYFERMYRLYQKKGWTHLIGSLSEQGRMQQEIMEFANHQVYGNLLKCIDTAFQSQPLVSFTRQESNPLFENRLVFIPSSSTLPELYQKTNAVEAELVLHLISLWKEVIASENLNWTIGVITPFRAQIAAILHLANQLEIDLSGITIDTVERYQGGARDIIIMSCAANHTGTLDRISSLNEEGIDRKLNVAITRARQQFILLGVEEVLQNSKAYDTLVKSSLQLREAIPGKSIFVHQADT